MNRWGQWKRTLQVNLYCHNDVNSVTRLVVPVYIIKKVYQDHIVGGLQTNPYIVKECATF